MKGIFVYVFFIFFVENVIDDGFGFVMEGDVVGVEVYYGL